MGETLKMVPSKGEPAIHEYPREKLYVPWGMGGSIALHLALIAIVAALAYLQHIRNLRDMMTASLPTQQQDQLQILLIDEKKEPPPTDNPLWIKQLIINKVKPPPPPPPPPKPKPKVPQQVRLVQHLVVGSHNLPTPDYPMTAYREHIQGTVMLRVAFDGSGSVSSAEVVNSSGSSLLDSSARHYILSNWHSVDFAGQVQTVPIQYVIPGG